MFRASLRSVSDPLRGHVCVSCLAQRFRGRPRLYQFYRTTAYRLNQGSDEAGGQPPKSRDPIISLPSSNQDPINDAKSPSPPVPPTANDSQPVAQASSSNASDGNVPQSQEDGVSTSESVIGGEEGARKAATGETEAKGKTPKINIVKQKKKSKKYRKVKRTHAKKTASEAAEKNTEKSKTTTPERNPVKPVNRPARMPDLPETSEGKESGMFDAKDLDMTPLAVEKPPVPRLSFGLERVLFNPGVYHLRDPRSRVYNFDPYLGSIMPVTEFDFTALKDYITSSRDETLRNVALKEKKKYIGSSSSMTSVLSQFHYLLSSWRPIDVSTISQGFPDKLRNFTRLSRSPAAVILRHQDGVYAIDADKEFDSANILMNLGKSMEKLLTLPKEEFERYRRSSENKISAEEEQAIPESYHYSTSGDFIMRSQLDAHDPRLPGTGMFDLKTRAVVSIRMDAQNFEHGLGYEIKDRFGAFESYEREFFDMIRAAFLKYSLQVRIGRMDGVFVAFHNIQRIFGFQYVSLPEMDQTLHGQTDTTLGDKEFQLSLALWNKILDKATAKFPNRSLRLHFEAREASVPYMCIFAEPVTDEEIHAIQNKNKAEIDAYQRRILNLAPNEGEADSAAVDSSEAQTSESINQPAESSDNENAQPQEGESAESSDNENAQPQEGESAESSGNEDAQPQEGDSAESEENFDTAAPPDEEFLGELEKETAQEEGQGPRELLGMTLFIKNKVNGKFVDRPINLGSNDRWTVEYELKELEARSAAVMYVACQRRRRVGLEGRGEDSRANSYIQRLRTISKLGAARRKEEDELDREHGVIVLGDPVPDKE